MKDMHKLSSNANIYNIRMLLHIFQVFSSVLYCCVVWELCNCERLMQTRIYRALVNIALLHVATCSRQRNIQSMDRQDMIVSRVSGKQHVEV
jgi:hypothetical protein